MYWLSPFPLFLRLIATMVYAMTYNYFAIMCYQLHCFFWEELEDTKGVIRIRISKKNRQHNGQRKMYKRTNNDLQKYT
jgi:hypothetical protein